MTGALLPKMVRLSLVVLSALMVSCGSAEAAPSFKKVIIVILENTNFDDAKKQSYLTKLARSGALLTNYHAQTHPSQPNYIELVAGSAYGVDDHRNGDLN